MPAFQNPLVNKLFLSSCFVPGLMLEGRDKKMNKTQFCYHRTHRTFRGCHVERCFQEYMAHAIVQVSTDFQEQHTLPGISGKGIIVKKYVGQVLVKRKKKGSGRKSEERLSRFKACICRDVDQEKGREFQKTVRWPVARNRAQEKVAGDEAGKMS